MQVKLLRVLQERAFEPVGSSQTKHVDVRVILASNVDLTELVAAQKFRQDLYYRINVVTIRLPALRERLGDIPLLAGNFLRQFSKESGREVLGFSEEAMAALQRYNWPGNVRELENAIERAVVLCRRPQIDIEDLPEVLQTTAMAQIVNSAYHGRNPRFAPTAGSRPARPRTPNHRGRPQTQRLESPGHRRRAGYQPHDPLQENAEIPVGYRRDGMN